MSFSMRWFKIERLPDDARQLATAACQRSNNTRDFAIYLGSDGVYFSPFAAAACEDLTAPYHLIPCEPSSLDQDELMLFCGDPTLLDRAD